MDVFCGKCKAKIKIPDEKLKKVPKGQTFSIACPKCKHKISVSTADESSAKKKKTKTEAGSSAVASNASGEDLLQELGFLDDGVQTALVCEPDDSIRFKLKSILDGLQYFVVVPQAPREALKMIRGHQFDLIVINELFGTHDPDMNHMLKYIEQLMMDLRREIFVTLLSKRFRSLDNMMAFNKSVNLIINLEDLDQLERLIKRGIADNDMFYNVYKDVLKRARGY
ncbi:hypothetical protein QUF76_07960 [Desulfobacterales bacterium HSG16]|nr:hypothetical protein [Desulfobacterales bacterium HSG16]